MSSPLVFSFFVSWVVLSGCSYRWTSDFPTEGRPSIHLCFVSGDEDGTMTSEIARAISASGMAKISRQSADFRLEISCIDHQNQIVGYRRDRQKINGKIKKNIVACEGRRGVTVEATLYRWNTEEIAYGPYQIAADVDYDYVDGDSLQDLTFTNNQGALTEVLPFSLGQLESTEAAHSASGRPLNERLAQKVVDVIFSEW